MLSKIFGIALVFVMIGSMLGKVATWAGKVANPTLLFSLFLIVVLAVSSLFPGLPAGQAALVSASDQTELITNGGFESGSAGWNVGGDFYADSRFSYSHSGTGYAYLSNADGTYGNNLAGTLEQTVTIPSSATSATLTFWYSITTNEPGSTPYDLCDVIIFDTEYNWLATAASLDNTDSQSPISYSQVSLDLTDYVGQTIKIVVEATTDESYPTVFRLDDFSILATEPPPPPPTLKYPPHNAEIDTLTPTLEWYSVSEADYYGLYISEPPYGPSHLVYDNDGPIYGTSLNLPGGILSYGTKYYWNMRSHNEAGWGSFSDSWCFTPVGPPPPPTLISPPDNSHQTSSITFQWGSVPDATNYRLFLLLPGSSSWSYGETTSTSYPYSPTLMGEYHWEVKAYVNGEWSDYSEEWVFYFDGSPAPSLISPLNDSETTQLRPTFQWSSVSGTTCYELQLARDSSFTDMVRDNLSIHGTSWQLDNQDLIPGQTYYWRVRCSIPIGHWSSIWHFTVSDANQPPEVTTNAATGIGTTSATLNGNLDSTGGLTCQVWFEYGTTTSYGSSTSQISKSSAGAFDEYISGLTPGVIYHFRACASNSKGTDYGLDRYFTTETGTYPPEVTTNAATGIGTTSATLNGNLDSTGGLTCQVWFEYGTTTSYGSSTSQISKSSAGAFDKYISGLTPGITYHFRARASNSKGTDYGLDRTFTTGEVPNQPPTLESGNVTPSSGDTSTVFSYYVNYTDSDGDAPTTKYVYVNGSSETMTKISGDYTLGATFKYSTTLSAGSYNYSFYFDDGHGHPVWLPPSGTYSGPSVSGPNQPPATEIIGGPSGTIDYCDVSFVWSGLDDITLTSDLVYSYYLEGCESIWSDWAPAVTESYYGLPSGGYTFKVKARDQAENIDPTPAERSFTISPNQPPVALFDYSPTEPKAGEWITLDAFDSYDPDGGEVKLYGWDLNDDDVYEECAPWPKIKCQWNKAGDYQITLRVTDNNGATNTRTKTITVKTSFWDRLANFFEDIWPWGDEVKRIKSEELSTIVQELDITGNWLWDNDLSWCTDDDLMLALNQEIDPEKMPGLSYGIYILNAIKEAGMLEDVLSQEYKIRYGAYFSNWLDLNTGWSTVAKSASEEALSGIIGEITPIGGTLLSLGLSSAKLGELLVPLKNLYLYNTLLSYFQNRRAGDGHSDAWSNACSDPIAPNYFYDNDNVEKRFRELWDTYEGYLSNEPPPYLKEQLIQEELRGVILSALENYKPNLPDRYIVIIESPVEIRVYDAQGNITGVIHEAVKEEIPYSAYDNETEMVVILYPSSSCQYQLAGINESSYGVKIVSVEGGEAAVVSAVDVPTSINATHNYTINWTALSQGEKAVTIEIDSDGDGVVDETVFTTPPDVPGSPSPSDNASNISLSTALGWTGSDPDGDNVTYKVYFGTDEYPPLVSENQTETGYSPGLLNYGTKYYWRVVARDEHGIAAESPVWQFTTELGSEWGKASTPYRQDWTIAPNSDILVPASIPGGEVIYVVGGGHEDNNLDNAYGPRLWKSEDSGVTWDELADNVWDADGLPANFNSSTSYFNYVACAKDDSDFVAVAVVDSSAAVSSYDYCNMTQAVVISDDGGDNFYWMGDVSDSSANATLNYIFGMAISDEDNDGKRNIAISGIGTRNGTCPRGLVFRFETGGLTGGHWVDASAYDGWDDDGAIASQAVTKVRFAPSWLDDRTVLAVSHTANATYLQSGTWGNTTAWNEPAGFEMAVEVANDPGIWSVFKGAAAGVAVPTDYEGRNASARYAWVYVDRTDGNGTIYRVKNGAVIEVNMQITDNPWLASLSYYGTIDEGKAIAGSLGDGTASPTDCCEGVQVYFNDGISDMDICCERWSEACKPPTGTMQALVGYVSSNKAYAFVGGTGASFEEGAFSFSLDDGDTWNQVGLVDTYVNNLSDVAKSPNCNKTWVVSVNTEEGGVCECDSVWLKADPLPEASEYSGAWIREWCEELYYNEGLLRLAPEETGEALTVYLVDRGTDTVYYDDNKGLGCWEQGSSTVDEISDLAVQDEATIYAVGYDGKVAANDDHGFSALWSRAMDSKVDTGHTIAVQGEGNVLVGGADGKVAYSDSDLATFLDGDASFAELDDIGDGNVHVAFDSYFDTNGVVYAAVSNVHVNTADNGIYRWVIGESSRWKDLGECTGTATPSETQLGLGPSCDTVEVGYYGIILSNADGNPETDATTGGVLYATFHDAANNVTGVARCLNPAEEVACGNAIWDYLIEDANDYHGAFTLEPSSLKICGCLTPDTDSKLWAIDDYSYYLGFATDDEDSSLGRLWTYRDCHAKSSPAIVAPADGAVVPCDINYWWNDAFALKWDRQCDARSYNLQIAYDDDFTGLVLDISGKYATNCTEVDYQPLNGTNPSYVVENGALGPGSCDTTFYWRVRSADAGTGEIIHGPWSEAHSFTVAGGAEHYNLTINSTSGGNVTTPGEGTFGLYNASEVVDLVATADVNYTFVNWTGDTETIANENSPTTIIIMKGNYSIVANFEEIPAALYNLTISSTDGGNVTTPGEGIFGLYNASEVVDLVATADSGYHFMNWTGDVGTIADVGLAATTITMTGNYSITANFAEGALAPVWSVGDTWVYDCSYENPGGNTEQDTCELNLTMVGEEAVGDEACYKLAGEFVPPATRDSADMPLTLHVETADIWNSKDHMEYVKMSSAIAELPGLPSTVTWNYTGDYGWPYDVGKTWNASVRVVSGPLDEITEVESKVLGVETITVPAGTFECYHIVTYEPASPANYTFEQWFSIVVKSDVKMIDRFLWAGEETRELVSYSVGTPPVQYSLTISSTSGGSVTTPGEGTFGPYNAGEVVKLVASANPDYHFTNWTGHIDTIADANSHRTTITMNGDYSITANFAEGAAEMDSEWAKVDTPNMDDWTIAPGSDIYMPALGMDGQRIYVIGTMWEDENGDGWIDYNEETARLWKSEDGAATWDDITRNVMKEIRDEFYDSNQSLKWTDMVAWFNFVTAAPDDSNFVVLAAYLGDIYDPANWTQVVLISDDGGGTFYLLGSRIQDSLAGTNLTDIINMNIAPEVDGRRNIAVAGIEDPDRSVVNPGIPSGDEEGRVYRFQTGGLFGRWEDAATGKPGWVNSTAVTWVYFSGMFADDRTIVAVTHNTKIDIPGFHVNCFPHTGNQSYFQTGTWSGSNVNWNEEASRGEAALLSNEPVPWWVIKGSSSGIGLPLDYDGRDKNTRYAWVTLNTAKEDPVPANQTTTGTIYRVVDGNAELVTQQVPGRPWLAMVFYFGMIDDGKAVAGVLGKGYATGILGTITKGLQLRTEDCEGVQVYRNDGIADMDICCQAWQPACKPPTGHGAALSIIAPPGGTKVYCVTTALTIGMNPKIPGEVVPNCHMWDKYDEGAFSVSFDEGDTWNQIGLIDTDIDYLTDVAQSPDCNTTYLASTNLNLTGERSTPPSRPEYTYYGVCDSVFFKSKNLAEDIVFARGYDDKWFRVWNGMLTNNSALNGADTPQIGLVRLAPEETARIDTVYFVDRGGDTVYYDSNKGLGCWETGSSTVDQISDLAVQDEATIYAVGFNGDVAANDDHGYGASWSSTMDSKVDEGHTIAVLGEGDVLVGGADGKVAYSDDDLATFMDGEASFTELDDIGDGRVHVAFDSYFDANSVIYAAVSNVGVNVDDNGIYRWVIDESGNWTDLGECAGTATPTETQLGLGPSCDKVEVGYYGIVLSNAGGNPETDATSGGVLYAAFYDAEEGVTGVARCLNPAEEVACGEALWDYVIQGMADDAAFTLEPSSLKICGCLSPDTNSKLCTIDDALYYNGIVVEEDPHYDAALGRLWIYEDCYAKAAPTLLSPADNTVVDADPHYWWNDAFILKWERQCDACSYNLQIAYDEDFTGLVRNISGRDADCQEIDYAPPSGSNPSYLVAEGALGPGSCGITFYWRVRSADAETGEIIHSPWSETRSFTVAGETEHYNLTISSTDDGNVTTPGEGTFTYNAGEVVDLVATADSGYQLVNWTGDTETIANENSPTTIIIMTGNYSIIANFAEVTAATLEGNVTFVGRGGAPCSTWIEPFVVKGFQAGNLTNELWNGTATTNNTGVFTIASLAPGTYDIGIKNATCLSKLETNVTLTAGATTVVDFGLIREGDADGNDAITILDFSKLAACFGTSPPGNPNCDFDRNNAITILDFSLLAGNFGQAGPLQGY